jgi:hypothetical protein
LIDAVKVGFETEKKKQVLIPGTNLSEFGFVRLMDEQDLSALAIRKWSLNTAHGQ